MWYKTADNWDGKNNTNNCTGFKLLGGFRGQQQLGAGGVQLDLGEVAGDGAAPIPNNCTGSEEKTPAARGHRGVSSKGGEDRMTPMRPRCQARSRSNPDPDAPSSSPMTPKAPNPNNSTGIGPKSPMVAAPSPHAECFMGISGLSAIFHYILWVMLNNTHIWCYIYHTRLSQSLIFSQFVRNILFCVRCDLLFDNVLLVDK